MLLTLLAETRSLIQLAEKRRSPIVEAIAHTITILQLTSPRVQVQHDDTGFWWINGETMYRKYSYTHQPTIPVANRPGGTTSDDALDCRL